ncbi:MAG: DUF58 domain-containing protein [Acidobacteriota bacterium]
MSGPLEDPGRVRSHGVQLTRVGMWFVISCVLIAVAAINTGNNGLFLTVAAMVAALLISFVMAGLNVSRVRVEADLDAELYANAPSYLRVTVHSRRLLLPSWLLVVSAGPDAFDPPERRRAPSRPLLVPHLAAGERSSGQLELRLRRRGPRRLRVLEVTSLFPLGLFRKGGSHPQEAEVLVYPEIFSSTASALSESAASGEAVDPRAGEGQDFHSLREYRQGDDPRGIHWKQTARQRRLIYQQRSTDRERRLRIVFDNAVGEPADDQAIDRFEHLVSEAATAAVEALAEGYSVALITRQETIDYATGPRHRRRLLEVLAHVQAAPEESRPLHASIADDPEASLRFGSARQEVA